MFRATGVFFVIACLALSIHAATIPIQVGQGGLNFVPQQVNCSTGDTLVFQWANGGSHSVVRSNSPAGNCSPYTSAGSFNSGSLTSGNFNYTVVETSGSIYYICDVPNHCQNGMWGVININNGSSSTTASGTPNPTTGSPTTTGSSSNKSSSASSTSITIVTLLVLVSSAIIASFLA